MAADRDDPWALPGPRPPADMAAIAEGDAADVADFWHLVGIVPAGADPLRDIGDCLNSGRGTIYLARDRQDIVGSVMVGHDRRRGWLHYVAVAPSWRGRGLGRAMVRQGETWVRRAGMRLCSLMVRDEAGAMVAFYRKLGYAIEPRRGPASARGILLTRTLPLIRPPKALI